MKGGAAFEEARRWLASIPDFDINNPVDGLYIARGVVDDLGNRVVKIQNGTVSNVRLHVDDAYRFWYFDIDSNSFMLGRTGGNDETIVNDIIARYGLTDYVYASLVQYEELSKDDIAGKLMPV